MMEEEDTSANTRTSPPAAITLEGLEHFSFNANSDFVQLTSPTVDAPWRWVSVGDERCAVDRLVLSYWLLAWGEPRHGAITVQELVDAKINLLNLKLTDAKIVSLTSALAESWRASGRLPLEGWQAMDSLLEDPSSEVMATDRLMEVSDFVIEEAGTSTSPGANAPQRRVTADMEVARDVGERVPRVTRAQRAARDPPESAATTGTPRATRVAATRTAARGSATPRRFDFSSCAELRWLSLVPVFALSEHATSACTRSFTQVARAGFLFAQEAFSCAPDDLASPLRVTSELLMPHLLRYLRLPAAGCSAATLAAGFPNFWLAPALPACYAGNSFSLI